MVTGVTAIVHDYFNTINIKTKDFWFEKRDETKKPVFRSDNSHLVFLTDLLKWAEQWSAMKTTKKLSKETFHSFIFTLRGLIALCEHLFEVSELTFILLSKINSDPIERRFGTYRQLSGANFFVSLKQFLQSEKKTSAEECSTLRQTFSS